MKEHESRLIKEYCGDGKTLLAAIDELRKMRQEMKMLGFPLAIISPSPELHASEKKPLTSSRLCGDFPRG